ncbi:hypothetical protein CfE428DRAFT_3101 [Chthoniobacter flavus Ellin428]|uniref:Small metal-binding protein n=1 Tax=Chthoniobacter flavus Ellin428 TaxID=497964 RepID=B4D2H6_9BACT|nr:hypothetical protein [Chthoniobacter flavus]EDY19416.1 hypothetical protein CfE428DRAFT_3101 [Chthoniobacter flavus Ellin428]TCO90457.1 hypothetical protein EV701_11080 [Chthoniobacter flavus]
MKNLTFRFLVLLCAFLVVGAPLGFSAAEDRQAHMEAALKALQEAKKSDTPAASLKTAKEELHKARHNKAGERLESIQMVDEALTEAQAGHHEKMIQKIDAAIADIHNGMAHAPGRR